MTESDKAVMQQALAALTESVDLVTNEYVEAVDLYSGYPSRLHRLTALKTALDAHNAAIDSLGSAIAHPKQQPERNFCARCGKRLTGDGIHTCTPPKDKQ